MKALMILSLLLSATSYASAPIEDAVCYSDMSDGMCKLTETGMTYDGFCTIDVTLTLKTGERVQTVLEGKSSVKKNQYALILNDMLKERAISEAYGDLSTDLAPFFTMETCK